MQQADAMMQLQQGNTSTSIIDLHGSPSDLPEEFLIDVRTLASPETNGTIIMNCSELESMNSRAISQVIQLLVCTRRQQQRLLVFGLSEHNRYILEITRLNQYIDIIDIETQSETDILIG